MNANNATPTATQGPVVYRNWIASQDGVPPCRAEEYPLYTDCWLTEQATHGPYQLLNAVPIGTRGLLSPAIVLRVDYHLPGEPVVPGRSNPADDLAALLSLCLGMRARAGNLARTFEPGKDPRGRPCAWSLRADPTLPRPAMGHRVLPELAASERSLERTSQLATIPDLAPNQADALVRAARLYRDGIWVADSEPELSWLMLVSAVETAAGQWQAEEASPVDILRLSVPDLSEILEAAGGQNLLATVAKLLAPLLSSTKKFISFIDAFMPGPPSQRPEDPFRYPWSQRNIRLSMGQIYQWRSRALHDGVPFPELLCMVPTAGQEIPLPIEAKQPTRKNPAPMLLQTFEYIVRHALLDWWRRMCLPSAPQAADPCPAEAT